MLPLGEIPEYRAVRAGPSLAASNDEVVMHAAFTHPPAISAAARPVPAPDSCCRLCKAFADSQVAATRINVGEEVFIEGEEADFAYRVEEGVLMSYRMLGDGRRQVVDFHLPGEFLGLEAGVEYSLTAQAVTPAKVIALGRRRLAMLAADDVRLTRDLWSATVGAYQRSQDHAAILARQSATERVAAFLLSYARRIGAVRDMTLPMSRQDMADFLGLAIHTVSRTLTHLEADGLIAARSSRQVRLMRRDRLMALCP